jgi:hypothetical protein
VDQLAAVAADSSGASGGERVSAEAGDGVPAPSTAALRILLIFAGACETTHALVFLLRAMGHHVVAIDTKLGGAAHDVLRAEVADALIDRISAGGFDACFMAVPCSSFSIRHGRQLRSRARPWGVDPIPTGYEAYVAKHNLLVRFALRVLRAARSSSTPIGVENPADRGDEASHAYWERFADWGSLFSVPEVVDELTASGCTQFTFAQCAPLLGGSAQKWTTIAASGELALELQPLRGCLCEHGTERHAEVLQGYDELGRSRAGAAAAYPEGLDRLLASSLDRAGAARRASADLLAEIDPSTGYPVGAMIGFNERAAAAAADPADHGSEGRITDGPELCPVVSSACEDARIVALRFSSLRNRQAAPLAALRAEAFPGDLYAPMPSCSRGACKARRRRPLPRSGPAPTGDACAAVAAAPPADGSAPARRLLEAQQLHLPAALAALAAQDALSFVKDSHFAWWAWPTERVGRHDPHASAVVDAEDARWLLGAHSDESLSSWAATLEGVATALLAQQSKRCLPAADHSRIDAFVALWTSEGFRHVTRGREPFARAVDAFASAWSSSDAAPIGIAELFLPGVYEGEILSWFVLADSAARALRAGRRPQRVPTRTIGQEKMQPWARGVVWDCSDPLACRPVRRSTRETVFPGRRQLDRDAIRRVAEILDWHDTDIIEQIGEGGVESRSDAELVTVLSWHHQSLLEELDAASASVDAHMAEDWTAPPVRHLPYVPCRMQPRGVVLQARARVGADGRLEEYMKPRITTDSSFGGVDSINAGVPDAERSVRLPSGQSFGRGWAICQSAFDGQPVEEGGGTEVQGYCIDAEAAYSFCPVQTADLWQQCFCWWDADGRTGVAVDRRMGFGGAFAPNRFERVSTFVAAYAQHLQSAFDTEQPPPICALRFITDRAELQRRGLLPPGVAQRFPRFLQCYLDDFTGAASTDPVVPPPAVASVIVDESHMIAAGCTPPSRGTRVYVHAQLCVLALRKAGLVAAPHKIACGSPLPALGLRFDGAARTISCPAGKRDALLASCEAAAEDTLHVDRRRARRAVGRLCNVSQVVPELRPLLAGGYAVCEVAWDTRRGRCADADLSLAHGSPTHSAWVALLEAAPELLREHNGVAMAPRRRLDGRLLLGSLTSITDASGEDGTGGFAFLSGMPRRVFVCSEAWPADVAAALAASADEDEARRRRSAAGGAAPALSMPAAELFGAWLLPTLVQRVADVRRVFAVVDCQPAAAAVNLLHSPKPQMQRLLGQLRVAPQTWAGAHVAREANRDADRLSHPGAAAEAVIGEATEVGLEVVRLRASTADWDELRAAIAAGAANPSGRRRKRKRKRE